MRLASAAIAALLLLPMQAQAQQPTYTPRNMALLPSYCKYTQYFRDNVPGGNNPVEIKHWMDRTQGLFHALHHYCWGLMAVNDATFFARSAQERKHKLGVSINEFDYVLNAAQGQPDFVLLPEIHTKKAESMIRLGRGPQAVSELQRAIELKPNYSPAYAALSDYHKASGDLAKAREVVEAGLSSAPDAADLKERLAQLDATATPRRPVAK